MDANANPNLARLIAAQLAVFPDHADYLDRRFANSDRDDLAFCEFVAGLLVRINGGSMQAMSEAYHWLTGAVLAEELHFRRTGAYRLSTFAQAFEEIYSDEAYMERYVAGILASQLWWRNHTAVLRWYRENYLTGFQGPVDHLEVGPGHGLFLYLAARFGNFSSLTGYDISHASLAATRKSLDAMATEKPVRLDRVDLLELPGGSDGTFGSITFSEVLEHLENPLDALCRLRDLLAPGGRIFVNAPVNSPAPDHLYLFGTPEEVVDMVAAAGLRVVDREYMPCTGSDLARARAQKLSISTVVVGERS